MPPNSRLATPFAVERVRFGAQRASVLSRLTTTKRQVRARLMDLEGDERPLVSAGRPGAGGSH